MKKKFKIVLPILILVFCVIGFIFAPNDPNASDLINRYAGCSGDVPLGRDSMGRCVLSRILYGGKTTLSIVLGGSVIIFVVGTALGIILSREITKSNIIVDSFINALTSIPPVAYLIVFIGAWGNGVRTMLIAMTASYILRYVKLVRTWIDIELDKSYVICAKASGASKLRIMIVHILPNIIDESIEFLCLSCANMILTITGFSFIGLGLGDNVVDWGSMILEARNVMDMRPMLIIYPMIFVLITSLSFNILGKEIVRKDRKIYVRN